MTFDQDRAELLALLEGLGAEDDEKVLVAAREAHRRVAIDGVGWEAWLRPGPSEGAPVPGDVPEQTLEEEPPATVEAAALPSASEADLEILERLLQRTDISPETREELEGLRADVDDGSFDTMDANYLRALDERLRQI